MAAKNKTELSELKEYIKSEFSQVSVRFDKLEKGQEDIKGSLVEIDKRLVAVETKVDSTEKRLGTVEGKLPDISEKFGELKNWRQIAFIIIAAVVGWFARSAKF